MKKRLTRIGNSLGIVLERPLLEKMQVDPEKDSFEISSDGSVIVITPVRQKKRSVKLKAVADRVFDEYAGVFKVLAE